MAPLKITLSAGNRGNYFDISIDRAAFNGGLSRAVLSLKWMSGVRAESQEFVRGIKDGNSAGKDLGVDIFLRQNVGIKL